MDHIVFKNNCLAFNALKTRLIQNTNTCKRDQAFVNFQFFFSWLYCIINILNIQKYIM